MEPMRKRVYLLKDRSSGRGPLFRPPWPENPGNQTTQQGQEHTTGPDKHTEREQKAKGQGRPHTQDTRKQAPGNGRTDEPEIQVAFPTFRFDLRRGTLAVLPPSRVSPVLISRRQPPVSEIPDNSQPLGGDGNHPSPKTATTRLRETCPAPRHLGETATTRLRRWQPPVSEIPDQLPATGRRRQPPVSEIPVQHPATWQRRQSPVSEIPDQLPTTWQGRQPLVSEDGNHPSPRYLTNFQPLGRDGNHPPPKTATTRLRDPIHQASIHTLL